jgi:uncharacterized protein YjbI with pentapeptide repeats
MARKAFQWGWDPWGIVFQWWKTVWVDDRVAVLAALASVALAAIAAVALGAVSTMALAPAFWVAWWLWWPLPKRQVNTLTFGIYDPKERADVEDNFRRTVSQLLGGAAVLTGIGVGYLQFHDQQRSAHDLLTSNQVSKGFEQLASDKIDMRLGGIYLLEAVMNDPDPVISARYHQAILEGLSAFVRDSGIRETVAIANELKLTNVDVLRPHIEDIIAAHEYKKHPINIADYADIEGALTVIGRRKFGGTVDLHDANLRRAKLVGADLDGAKLSSVYLPGARLNGAHLKGADLSDAHLKCAKLPCGKKPNCADLRGADLRDADLTGADLRGADLRGADLRGADLTGARLTGTKYDKETRLPAGFKPDDWRMFPASVSKP